MSFVPDRARHDHRYALDITKIQNKLGRQSRQSLLDGLRKTIHWYLDYPKWVHAIRNRGDYQM